MGSTKTESRPHRIVLELAVVAALLGCGESGGDSRGGSSGGSAGAGGSTQDSGAGTGGAGATSGSAGQASGGAGGSGTGGSAASGGSGGTGGTDAGTDGPPGELPLIQIADLVYQGAFRVPAADFGISSMNYSEGPLAYDAAKNSIYIVGHNWQQALAEFAMPALVNSTMLSDLNMAAAPIQTFATLFDRVSGGNPQDINRIAGLSFIAGPSGTELLVHGYEYYDAPADNTHTTLVVRDPTNLAGSTVDGFYALDGVAHAGGWISPIPAAWQALLGGTHITGNSSGVPIISRLSVGPSAFVFDPLAIVGASATSGPVATSALLDYDLTNGLSDDLSNDSGTNDLWTHLSRAVFGFVVPGTRSYVTLGHSGGHASGVCYKCTPTGSSSACGGYCSNDSSDYSQYYWLFDVNDLVAVKQGTLAPHAVQPYAHGPFTTPFSMNELGGGAFDPASGLLYLTVQRGDTDQGAYANPPVIVAYRIQ